MKWRVAKVSGPVPGPLQCLAVRKMRLNQWSSLRNWSQRWGRRVYYSRSQENNVFQGKTTHWLVKGRTDECDEWLISSAVWKPIGGSARAVKWRGGTESLIGDDLKEEGRPGAGDLRDYIVFPSTGVVALLMTLKWKLDEWSSHYFTKGKCNVMQRSSNLEQKTWALSLILVIWANHLTSPVFHFAI